MCGIVGIVGWNVAPGSLAVAESRMRSALDHRGPDGEGGFADGPAALGHRRLSIIDLAGGAQPMQDEAGRFVLVCNGEIYNYRALRSSLADRHRFETASDSEVLVHLIEECGATFPDRLDGMYAYAIWDRTEERLHLGVDRFGVKPLYYALRDGALLFASELRAIAVGLSALGHAPALDIDAADVFLRVGFFPGSTALDGVQKLGPGDRLSYDRAAGLRRVAARPSGSHGNGSQSGDPAGGAHVGQTPGTDGSADRIERALRRSVEKQLIADVPVGVLLSGGIDSSLVAAMAGRTVPGIDTFTVDFRGEGSEIAAASEAAYARNVAASIGANHHELPLTPGQLASLVEEAWRAMDEPIADAAVVPLLALCRFARSRVKACLGGDGGDEMFGGYFRHVIAPVKNGLHRAGGPLLGGLRTVAKLAPRAPSEGSVRTAARRAGVALGLLADPAYVPGPFSGSYGALLARGAGRIPDALYHPASDAALRDYDLTGQMWGQHLQKTDRVGMWTGLEVRVPFLDPEVAAVAASLPRSARVRGTTTKAALREVASRYVPREIVRRPKQGFRVPLSGWLRGALRERVEDGLRGGASVVPSALIAPDRVDRMVADHLDGRAEHAIRIWAVLVLDDWIRRTIPA